MSNKASTSSLFFLSCCALPIFLYLLLRFPFVVHQMGQQDEQWFSVPGWTVSQEGIPRIPYIPNVEVETFFKGADRCLMALPPGLFYVQAPFFWILPPGYPPSRFPSLIAGAIVVGLAVWLTLRITTNVVAAISSGIAVALCRPIAFTSIIARPDLLCALSGFVALGILWFYARAPYRNSFFAGVTCGAGALFHPFALVFSIQSFFWILLEAICMKHSLQKLFFRLILLLSGFLVAISLWLPLIWSYPTQFSDQFMHNVVNRAGPGLMTRLLMPIGSIQFQLRLIGEFLGPIQLCVLGGLFVVSTVVLSLDYYKNKQDPTSQESIKLLAIGWSSCYFLATVSGYHPTKGYWVYPVCWMIVVIFVGLSKWIENWIDDIRPRFVLSLAASIALIISFIPGAGIRTSLAYLTHWGDSRFCASIFIRQAIREFDKSEPYLVDPGFVFDVYLMGRDTTLADPFISKRGEWPKDYGYLLLTQSKEDNEKWAIDYQGKLVEVVGDNKLDSACRLDVYQRALNTNE